MSDQETYSFCRDVTVNTGADPDDPERLEACRRAAEQALEEVALRLFGNEEEIT
jgi:hypothetical protein